MKRRQLIFAPVFILFTVFAGGAQAGTVTTTVDGQFNNSQENACIHVSRFYYLTDCSYARTFPELLGNELPWTGPTVNPIYYVPGSPETDPNYEPFAGDARIAPRLSGTLTIDDRGTPDPNDDLISGDLEVGPAARNVVANVNELTGPGARAPRTVITWSRITHTLEPTAVHTATSNDHGGYDYVIGSKGFPIRLCRTEDGADCFPSARAPKTTDGQDVEDVWNGPATVGLTREEAMDGNIGAKTDAFMHDYSCVDNRDGVTCPSHNVVWRNAEEPAPGDRGQSEAPGLDNLLLKVVTDQSGRILTAEGFWTQEYFLAAGPASMNVPDGHNNSWQGGYLSVEGVVE